MAIDINQLSPEAREKAKKLTKLQDQVQSLTQRKQELVKKSRETDKALDELEGAEKDRSLYQSIGAMMVKRENPEKVKAELRDKQENLDLKTKQVERREEKMKKQLEGLRAKVRDVIKRRGAKETGRESRAE